VPRRRLRKRSKTAIATLGVACVSLLSSLSLAAAAEPDRKVVLEFNVVDAESQLPIKGASIRVADAYDLFGRLAPPQSHTTADGCAKLATSFPLAGERRLFRITGPVSFRDR
jgi:hypothetical protein